MFVKIGNVIYDSCVTPIMLVLSDRAKQQISNMDPEQHRFCLFPEEISNSDVKEFMNDPVIVAIVEYMKKEGE